MTGNVTAVLVARTGVLNIAGDASNGNNGITIAASPIPGDIRVSGNVKLALPPTTPPSLPDVTTVNGVAYTDFVASSITGINVAMANGNDTVLVNPSGATPLAIGGNLAITLGGGTDVVTVGALGANQVAIKANGPGADAISLAGTTAGLVSIQTGTGADKVSLKGGSIGTATINTGAGPAADSISVTGFPAIATKPGIGLLSIVAGDGPNAIVADNLAATQVTIKAGAGANAIDASGDTISGLAGLAINAGVAAGSSIQSVTVSNDSIPLGNLAIGLGDGPAYYSASPAPGVLLPGSTLSLAKVTVGKAASIVAGANFRSVAIGTDNASNFVTAGTLALSVGSNEDLVAVNARVKGAETVGTGNFTTYPSLPVPPSSLALGGTAGSLALTVGDNARTVAQSSVVVGAESVAAGNGEGAVTIARPTSGSSTIAIGNNLGSLAVTGVDTGGPSPNPESVAVGTNAGSITLGGMISGDQALAVAPGVGTVADSASSGSQTVTIGSAKPGAPAGVTVSGLVTRAQAITVGDYATLRVTSPSSGSSTINAGSNGSVTLTGLATSGPLAVAVGSGETLSLASVKAAGDVSVKAGSAASVALTSISTPGDIAVAVGDAPAYVEVYNSSSSGLAVTGGNGGSAATTDAMYAFFDDVATGGMDLEFGDGNNAVELVGLSVLNGMTVGGGSGNNAVYVQGTAADYGVIDGGSGSANDYYDLGGNSDTMILTGFDGFFS